MDNRATKPVIAFIPPSCCGAGYFRPLRRALGDRVDFRGLELPGHGRRFDEPRLTEAAAAVRDLAGRLDGPVDAVYGESLGAYIGLALAAELPQPRPPVLLAVSNTPPSVRESPLPRKAASLAEAIAMLTAMGGEIPADVMADPALSARVFPLVRDDLLLSGSFIESLRTTRCAGDIHVVAGYEDASVGGLDAWSRHTSGRCSVVLLPGGHLLSAASPSAVAEAVLGALPYGSPERAAAPGASRLIPQAKESTW
ncbi:thioesterase II family protein [Streptomyces sp. NPDC088755]|uniref:thioesterase II family protein n=1 Tax=Streptomyces sp. NPDC088755 TaxID=3365888 RepID=UPI0037FA39FE